MSLNPKIWSEKLKRAASDGKVSSSRTFQLLTTDLRYPSRRRRDADRPFGEMKATMTKQIFHLPRVSLTKRTGYVLSAVSTCFASLMSSLRLLLTSLLLHNLLPSTDWDLMNSSYEI